VLGAHPDVGEVAVIGVPDVKWGEAVTAVVVPREGTSPTVSTLVEFARTQLAGYKCPRQVTFLRSDEMPRTATGKLLHRVLRDRFASAGAAKRESANG
jgi:fatty-acyl-CoA synthase